MQILSNEYSNYKETVDPRRLDYARSVLAPAEYDFGGDNFRSPNSTILNFANAVLHNRAPLPRSDDVIQLTYSGNDFAEVVHAAVFTIFLNLRRRGLDNPCVAVLARTNALVAQLSGILQQVHRYRGNELQPIEHDVMWDAELSAAAVVVGSILEWQDTEDSRVLARTLQLIARFFELRNADNPSQAVRERTLQYRKAAEAVLAGKRLSIKGARELALHFSTGIMFLGDPIVDWKSARQLLRITSGLDEIYEAARMMRLFRMTDTLGTELARKWLTQSNYEGAALLVQRILDQDLLVGSDQDPDGCIVMNIHKSKGKEFDGVVLIEGQYSGQFFDTRRKRPPYQQCRQLLRVGITRARFCVIIVRPQYAIPLVDQQQSAFFAAR